MKINEIFINGTKGSYLHVLSINVSNAKGNFHIIHGMGEHAKRYTDFAKFIAELGYNVYMHDHRAHGKSLKANQSVGILEKEDTLFNMTKDITKVKDYIDTQEKLPYYILGHSMGSIIVRYLLQNYPSINVKKAIIMGTLPKYPIIQVKAMRLLAVILGIFKPTNKPHQGLASLLNQGLIKTVKNPKTPFDWLSYNEENVNTYINDPLSGYAYNKRFYQYLFKFIDVVNHKKSMSTIQSIPLLFIAGNDDPINNHLKSIEKLASYYQKINPSLPLKIIGIKHARHEILHEDNRHESYEAIQTFLAN
ncbi:MAG: alpha/beta fold hydrolase [Candidatus Izemoplasmataceae bacterium]